MAIASRLKWFLDVNRVKYEVLPVAHDDSSGLDAPPPERLVVSELFRAAEGFLMVVHPASRRVAIAELEKLVGSPLHPVKESEVVDIFFDCEKGVVPPLGPAYGVPTVVDDSTPVEGDLFFCAGDSADLIHMTGAEFSDLVADARHARVSVAATPTSA